MKSGSEYEKYPFGVLQKVHHRVTNSMDNLHKAKCMNVECNKRVKQSQEYCCSRCYDKMKYERSVSGSWK